MRTVGSPRSVSVSTPEVTGHGQARSEIEEGRPGQGEDEDQDQGDTRRQDEDDDEQRAVKRAIAALDYLRKYALTHEAVLVAYSGGKDSLVVADLAVRVFKRVVGFMYYIAPGLEVNDRAAEVAKARFGIEVRQYPSANCLNALREGLYCDSPLARDDWPEATVMDIYRLARADAGIHLVADGCRKQDSPRRRQLISKGRLPEWNLTPLGDWITYDVKAYLALRNIPLPEKQNLNEKSASTGVSLVHNSLLWLHDRHPKDFATLCRVFPYAEAVIKRRDFYGLPAPARAAAGGQ